MNLPEATSLPRCGKGIAAGAGLVFWLVAVGAGSAAPGQDSPAKTDFNREIRPILTENCYKCHGPDDGARKAKLRFDVGAEALKPAKSGLLPIVPGHPEKSELVARITAVVPDDRMPPSASGKKLSPSQIEALRRWIAQGAPFALHWAYVKPMRPSLPEVRDRKWPRNPVDRFILARLQREGLKPSPPADRYVLARRVSLDLTGLPPTPEEVDRFVNERNPHAYEDLVDRLLKRRAFGEHWARHWLDLARYADSAGYADDPPRTIWGFRDYVIRAFNSNKPFDVFTLEQIAGDLFEEPTEEDRVATAFHRNTMTNNEGGTDDEEFRNAAVVDRVNTTMSVWMATTMACAQCHNHKYDPISQEEYFRVFAFFNNTEDADRTDEAPVLEFYSDGQKQQRDGWQAEIVSLEQKLQAPTPESLSSQAKWQQDFPLDAPWLPLKPAKMESGKGATMSSDEQGVVRASPGQKSDVLTLELPLTGKLLAGLRLEELPDCAAGHPTNGSVVSRVSATLLPPAASPVRGRYVRIELPGSDRILSLAEVQVFHGSNNLALRGEASQSSTAYDASARLAIDGNTDGDFPGAKSTTHTAASDNPWWEVDLKAAQIIDRVVIWNRTDGGLESRLANYRVVVLDEQRQPAWEKSVKDPPKPSAEIKLDGAREVRFAAAYADVSRPGFEALSVTGNQTEKAQGWTIDGDGKSHQLTLLTGKPIEFLPGTKLAVSIEQRFEGARDERRCFRIRACSDGRLTAYADAPSSMLEILSRPPAQRTERQTAALTEYYRANLAPGLQRERARLQEVKKRLAELKPATVPVMRELSGEHRRKTHIEFRGNFLALGDEVTEAVPVAFHPLARGATANRLALARWLVDTNNPLTARVLANRLWEQIFGIGIVRTSEDFGSQGERPTHAELLDWLACQLRDGEHASTAVRPWDIKAFLKLLVTSATYCQSSRVTSELEQRDPDNQLLARGPRVRLPAEVVRDQALAVSGLLSTKMFGPSVRPLRPALGLSAAFGGSLDWKTSEGEDRYRRALYVEWRRTSPYPSMATFDSPNREVCTVRRPRSNTPLQALVTLNDPVYVEAAQALGRRMAGTAGAATDKVTRGFRLCLARPPLGNELERLVAFYQSSRSHFANDATKARQMAGDSPAPAKESGDVVELAAWTTVGNVLLNLDETLMPP